MQELRAFSNRLSRAKTEEEKANIRNERERFKSSAAYKKRKLNAAATSSSSSSSSSYGTIESDTHSKTTKLRSEQTNSVEDRERDIESTSASGTTTKTKERSRIHTNQAAVEYSVTETITRSIQSYLSRKKDEFVADAKNDYKSFPLGQTCGEFLAMIGKAVPFDMTIANSPENVHNLNPYQTSVKTPLVLDIAIDHLQAAFIERCFYLGRIPPECVAWEIVKIDCVEFPNRVIISKNWPCPPKPGKYMTIFASMETLREGWGDSDWSIPLAKCSILAGDKQFDIWLPVNLMFVMFNTSVAHQIINNVLLNWVGISVKERVEKTKLCMYAPSTQCVSESYMVQGERPEDSTKYSKAVVDDNSELLPIRILYEKQQEAARVKYFEEDTTKPTTKDEYIKQELNRGRGGQARRITGAIKAEADLLFPDTDTDEYDHAQTAEWLDGLRYSM